MRTHRRNIVGLLILAAAFLPLSLSGLAYADDCVALGGVLVPPGPPNECQISLPVTKSGFFQLDETLHMLAGGVITVSPVATGLSINITGSFIMNAGSQIIGDNPSTASPAAAITITATQNMTLCGPAGVAPGCGGPSGNPGAIIQSNNTGGSCNQDKNPGGNITLNAGTAPSGIFIMEGPVPVTTPPFDASGNLNPAYNGSEVLSISPCGRGEIIITAGQEADIDGVVLSQATKTGERGGPITVIAGCTLTESDSGAIVSKGQDLGADLVHLQASCQVQIFGLVASTGPGHKLGSDNRCNAPIRPSHSNRTSPYTTACVEIWAGNNTLNPGFPAILIDSRPPHNGQVHADTAQSGGVTGNGWIEIFARGDIEIDGETTGVPAGLPFAVHVNQYRSGGHGGQITVKSTEAGVSLLGLALQTSANKTLNGNSLGGGQGGTIIVEAKKDVDLNNSNGEIEADGSTTGSSAHGGHIKIRSFGTVTPDGSIVVVLPFLLDVTGGIAPDGTVDLTACGPIGAPTTSAGATVTSNTPVCGGVPTLPIYPAVGVIPALPPLPACAQCGGQCACVTNFTPVHAPGGATLTLNGDNMTHVTSVIFGSTCDPASAAANGTVNPPFTTQTPTQVQVTVPGALANGTYKIIITNDLNGSCCAPGLFTKP